MLVSYDGMLVVVAELLMLSVPLALLYHVPVSALGNKQSASSFKGNVLIDKILIANYYNDYTVCFQPL